MSNLIIKDFSINNIFLKENNNKFLLKYDFKIFKISDISILIKNIIIVHKDNKYLIKLENKDDISTINKIDSFFSQNVKNYKNILNNDYIHLSENYFIKKIFNKNLKEIILTIKCIKKKDNNIPIIHINERKF
jgi:hypothetical protein